MYESLTRAQFVRWRTAIFIVFAACGLGFATWAGRVPAIKAELGITKTEVGMALVASGIASIIGLSVAAVVSARFGNRLGMLGTLTIAATGLVVIGVSTDVLHSYPGVIVGLALFGFGNGCCDVLMNIEGASVETVGKKTVLPMCHGFFSLGTFVGAGAGALAEAVHLPVSLHTMIVAGIIVFAAIFAVRSVPVDEAAEGADAPDRPTFRERLHVALSAWTEPRTYLLGLILLGMGFAEGGANDWLALGMVEGHGASQSLGAIGLAVFSGAMTLVRMFGGPLVDRFGRVASLRVLAVLATTGVLLFILAPNLPLIFVGAVLWGVGVALGFPLGMSAAADDPERAAARVSAAATIGYVAFLAGPPTLGFIADHIGLLNTLFILVGLIVVSGLASGAAKPLVPKEQASTRS